MTRVVTPGMVLDEQIARPARVELPRARWRSTRPARRRAGPPRRLHRRAALRRGGERRAARRTSCARAGVRELLLPALGGGLAARPRRWRGRWAPRSPRCDDAAFQRADEKLRRHLGVAALDGFGVGRPAPRPRRRRRRRLHYLSETQRAEPRHVDRIVAASPPRTCCSSTRAPAPTWRSSARSRAASARARSSGCSTGRVTGAGGRRLAEWLRYPLTDVAAIDARLDAVEELAGAAVLRERAGRGAPAGGRRGAAPLAARAAAGQRPGPARAGRRRSRPCRRSADLLEGAGAGAARASRAARCAGWRTLAAALERAVADEPPATLAEGGMIRRGWSEELDRIVDARRGRQGTSSPGSRPGSGSAPASARSRSATTGSSATTSRSPSPTSTSCPPDYSGARPRWAASASSPRS